jgi:hypothetical protein
MPEIRVEDEQGTVHVFPDGSTPDMIAKVMNVKPPSTMVDQSKPTQFELDRRSTLEKFRDWLTQDELGQQARKSFEAKHGKLELPGAFEGKPENVGDYVPNTVGEMAGGVADIARGKVAKGAHRIISGGTNALLPVAPFAVAAAPGAAVIGAGGGLVGGKLFKTGAEAVGANPDQAQLAEDVGSFAGGYGAMKAVPGVVSLGKRALLLGRTPEEAYQSALKPSTTLSETERAAITKTGLREQIPVTKDGLDDLHDLISDLNTKIKAQIASDPSRPINKFSVASKLTDTANRFANQVSPTEDLESIGKVGNDFLNTAPNPIPAARAQAMKQGTYQALTDKAYGEVKGASIEAQKALARGLKEEIARIFPEISKLNARESQLFDLEPVLERAIGRIGNHQLMGIGTPVAAGAAKAVTGSNKAGAVVGLIKAVLDNPAVKSRLAIALSKGGRIDPATAIQRVSAYSTALAQAALRADPQSAGDTPGQ